MRILLLCFFILLFRPGFSQAEIKTERSLYQTILEQDSLLYDAYNHQDYDGFIKFFSKDLEWYKDLDGKMNYDTICRNFRQVFSNANHSQRRLIRSTLEVYPLKDFGAISMGMHEVNYTLHDKLMKGTFKFFMVWKKEGETWMVTRVFSYGH